MKETAYPELNPPPRILLGPGPANVDPRVLRAMIAPILGHLDPDFIQIMDETQDMLRLVFDTSNDLTIPASGTGTAGMEASLCNLLEPGDTAIVCINGYFGGRLADMASRYGAQVVTVEAEWGDIIPSEQVEAALRAHPKTKLVAIVHGETSTGVYQPLEEISRLVHRYDALFLVDTVTTLGGCQVAVDAWGIDACYSASQKCLGCPPGLAPLTFGPRAVEAMHRRKTKPPNLYLDLSMLENYWGGGRIYHHTAPITMIYALHEGLRVLAEEGLEGGFARHRRNSAALQAGLEAMGLALHARQGYRLPPLTTVRIPPGVDDARVRRALLLEHGIEIGAGFGKLGGQIWRIGLMGYNATPSNVLTFLGALESVLRREGLRPEPGAGVAAAARTLSAAADGS
ncbi:MAG: pyridoxal-phosphate-dependent aminotransferase family protein [Dehalococcoidia bacterium]